MNENNHLETGKLWLERERPEKAVKELQKAIADDPEDPEAYACLGQCYGDLEKYKESLEMAVQAIGLEPEWPLPYLIKALALAGLGKTRAAINSILEAIELDPEEAEYYGVLSRLRGRQKRWKDALETAEQGLELDPESEDCLSARALALIQTGKGDSADFALESALQRNPDDSETHELMGWSELNKGNAKAAAIHYREALQLDPDSNAARKGLVESLKAKNIIYRMILKWFLLLTRIKFSVVLIIMIASVFIRSYLLSLAESYPILEYIVMPFFFLILAFVAMTWIAVPLFNLLLRLDREGRYALTDKDIKVTNWLIGNIFLIMICLSLWIFGIEGMGLASVYAAILIIPLITTLEANSPKITAGFALFVIFLVGTGVYSVVLENRIGNYRNEAQEAIDKYNYIDASTLSTAELKKINEKISAVNKNLIKRKPLIMKNRETANILFNIFIFSFVAFTWISQFILLADKP